MTSGILRDMNELPPFTKCFLEPYKTLHMIFFHEMYYNILFWITEQLPFQCLFICVIHQNKERGKQACSWSYTGHAGQVQSNGLVKTWSAASRKIRRPHQVIMLRDLFKIRIFIHF